MLTRIILKLVSFWLVIGSILPAHFYSIESPLAVYFLHSGHHIDPLRRNSAHSFATHTEHSPVALHSSACSCSSVLVLHIHIRNVPVSIDFCCCVNETERHGFSSKSAAFEHYVCMYSAKHRYAIFIVCAYLSGSFSLHSSKTSAYCTVLEENE